jgi:N-glycosylase/DNA lyase
VIVAEFGLRGAGGEPVSFERTVHSHGLAALAPATIRPATAALPLAYHRTLSAAGRIVEATLRERSGRLVVETRQKIGKKAAAEVAGAARRMFRLDDDLAPFYRRIASDARLSWAAAGAGRILASPTVFEDVVKTLCTTNCAWSGTVRMTQALASLGGGAFPDAGAIGSAPASWFRDVARMGYRGPYLHEIAREVRAGRLDFEELLPARGKSDAQVEEILLALPGVGPYAAAHIMMLLGRNRRLVLDSWTRPSYLRLAKKKRARDSSIERAFAPYGEYAGLAFWLFLTRDWVGDDA